MSRQHAAAAILFIALAVLMTWPLVLNLDRAVSDPGDPYVNIWVLDWDWWATLNQPLSLFHANALHPARYTLAFSENLYGIALLLFPLRLLGLSPITAYNVAMLLGFAFSGFSTCLLGKRLTGCWSAGIAAGVFYAFVPFRFTHVAHIQHVWGGWLPLLLVALLWYADAPSARRAAWFGAAFLMNGLTNIHNLLFGTFAIAVTAVLLLPRRAWRDLAIAVAVAAILLAPFLYPYHAVSKLYGAQRTAGESDQFSANPSDWLPGAVEPERKLYPGAIAITCAVAALFLRQRPKMALALLWMAIGFAGSLGMNFEFHRFLFGAVPGFRVIRAPARWAVIAYVGLAIAIALVTAAIARRNRWLAYVLPVALLVELNRVPIRWYMSVPDPPAVYLWLAEGKSPIAELPIDSLGSEYVYYLRSTAHHRPMINGGAGTPVKRELSARWWASPIGDDFVEASSRAGVDLMIVHADRMGGKSAEVREWLRRELDRGRIAFVRRFDAGSEGDWVFRLGPAAGGGARDPRLERFLAGQPTCSDSTHGALDAPSGHEPLRDAAMFSGWAISPHGIRRVDLLFNNRTVRIPATLHPPVIAAERCPSYPFIRFTSQFPHRPAGVRARTDVQVDVVDGRGEVTSYESRWLRWD